MKSEDKKLKIVYNKKHNEINVYGNEYGLLFLSEICKKLSLTNRDHYHIASWNTNFDLVKDSLDIIIWHIEDFTAIR